MKKYRTSPFLGAFKLNWCDNCNIPLLDTHTCGLCQGKARKVFIAPPGDIRPAFKGDIKRIAKIIDDLYGEGSAEALGLTGERLVILNEVSYDDLMDEIIIDGQVIGSIRYNLALESWDFHPRFIGAQRIFEGKKPTKRYVIVDDGAVRFVSQGYNILAPGVVDIDPNIKKGEAAVALSLEGKVLSCGIMRINAKEVDRSKKGVVLKPKHFLRKNLEIKTAEPRMQIWRNAVTANLKVLDNYEAGAIKAIKHTIAKHPKMPLSVSFSGGKDSLVCLQLARKIPDLKFKVIFVNTSLEFPETIVYIEEIIDELNLRDNYCRLDVPEDRFWISAENYGPPGKDYRYCCKLQKIGPVNDLIDQCVGQSSLSLIGQRAYESIARASSKKLWSNPWIPNQLNYTPIQKWTALHIWLYIFKEQLRYNPLYEKGFTRIGCWMCPASNQGTFEIIKETMPELWESWEQFLIKWQEKNELPREWLTWGLWRWKKLPKKIIDLAKEQNVDLSYETKEKQSLGDWELTFNLVEGFATCKSGEVIIEGVFNSTLNLVRIAKFWLIHGQIDLDEELGILTASSNNTVISLTVDGAINAKGASVPIVKEQMKKFVLEIFRAIDCDACEVCLNHCPSNALVINNEINQIEINEELCSSCEQCFTKCPVINYGHREIRELFSKENN
jgi:phosphoadenosine phosphosulfate reductase